MRDYRLDKKEHLDDILNVTKSASYVDASGKLHEVDAIDIHFADGKVFKGVANTEEELKKIAKKQETQVETGIENLPVFERRTKAATALAITSTLASPIIATASASMLTPIFDMQSDPIIIPCAGVAIALCGVIPAGISLAKNLPIVKELNKLKYRNENNEKLNSINDHPNALVGLSKSQAKRIRHAIREGEDPFGIESVDEFTQSDLEMIMSNIQREEDYGFQYAKKSNHSRKNK